MQGKASSPVGALAGRDVPPLIEAYFELNHLKQLYRQGWLRRGVPPERCESVAEHSFGVAVLAMWLRDAYAPGLDRCKVMHLALLHDLGEIYAGDITPSDAVESAEKHRLEEEAIVQVLAKLPNGATYVALWHEYERQETPEARFVRQIDRLEMALQASVYQVQGLIQPDEFFASAEQDVSLPELRELLSAIEDVGRGR